MAIVDDSILRILDFPSTRNSNHAARMNPVSLLDNEAFQRFINIDLRGPIIEVPVVCRDFVTTTFVRNLNLASLPSNRIDKCEYLVFSLYVGDSVDKRSTAAIIRSFFETSAVHRLTKVTTSTGEVYYGGAGIIFNSRWECLFLSTVTHLVPDDPSPNDPIKIVMSTVYLNPSIFLSNGVVEKNIIKKIVPTIIDGGVVLQTRHSLFKNDFNDRDEHNVLIKRIPNIVVTDDINKFISTPGIPDVEHFNTEEVNKWLLDNLSAIRSNMIV